MFYFHSVKIQTYSNHSNTFGLESKKLLNRESNQSKDPSSIDIKGEKAKKTWFNQIFL